MAEEERDTPVKDAVPTEPEETRPTPETPPAVSDPDDIRDVVGKLSERVDALTESVNGIVNSASPDPDTTPVRKPWTHWGSR